MSDTNTHPGFGVTAEDLRRYDWQARLAKLERKECYSFYEAFSQGAKECHEAKDDPGNRVFSCLAVVASFHPNYDTRGNPYCSMWNGFNGKRSLNAEDLTDADLAALAGIVEEIQDPEFRARVADVLWTTKKNFKAARTAIAAFLESAQRLKTDDLWPPYTERLERASRIAATRGFEQDHKTCVAAVEAAIAEFENNPKSGLLCHRLMSMLLAQGEGDATRYAALSERLAAECAKSLSWDFSEAYWLAAEQWHRLAKKDADAQRCLLAAAECNISRGEAGLSKMGAMYAAHWLGRGVEALRRGKGVSGAPKSIGEKLALTLLFYLLFGCFALFFLRQPVFALAVYLHAMTFVFLGMFVAASAGEILFNKEEADILLHRPVSPKAMLWAKIRVLVEVSLWLAGAFNLVGLLVGLGSGGNWRFPIIHVFSTMMEALFCTGCVVLVYQLCLRWFGRERLENLMTISQVIVSIAAVMASQILPQMVMRVDRVLNVSELSWWVNLLPPAWFAGLDDAFSGSGMLGSWILAAIGLGATALVLWIAFDKLARDYEIGLQALNEMVSTPIKRGSRRRLIDRLVNLPPLSWWLRDPVTRASFLLTAAYLLRDRDVKLRVYPGIAPILIIPFIFLIRNQHPGDANDPGFGVPFSGIYLGMVPLFGLQMLQYSQQWQAADIFRVAPLSGPAAICHGARRAVLCLLALPMLLLVGLIVWLLRGNFSQLLLFLPGIIALPVFALVPHLGGHGVPLSQPTDAAKSASRGLNIMLVMFIAFALAGLASVSWTQGWFWWLVLGEAMVAIGLYSGIRLSLANARWSSSE